MKKILRLYLILLVLVWLLGGCGEDKVNNDSSVASLIGTWKGTDEGMYDVNGVLLVFKSNDRFTFDIANGIYQIDESVWPHHIDLVFDEDVQWGGENVGRNFYGLYELDKSQLKANWDPNSRPESFESYGYHIWIKQ
jgi:hypothetical protein